ncbi:MAG: LytTR family DNA-binding domain-containing protein [Paracoccaceae bacterium]
MALFPASEIEASAAVIRPALRDPRFWAGLVGLGLVLGVAGPFGTLDNLPLLPRLAYWTTMILITGPVGFLLSHTTRRRLQSAGLPRLPASFLSGTLMGLPIAALVLTLNAVFLEPGDVTLGEGELALAIVFLSATVSPVVTLVFFSAPDLPPAAASAASAAARSAPPRLLQRIPEDLQAPLVALTAIDHYTEVVTTRGRCQILLRFSDAVAESAPTLGLRIHRSHWVALDQITAARRDGLRAIVTLTDGRERPVSRGNITALEQAGYLPPR